MHIHPGHHDQQDCKPGNQGAFSKHTCISSALLCNPECLFQAYPVCYQHYFVTQSAFSKHTLYINSTSYPLGDTLLSSAGPSRNPVVSPNRARVTTLVNSQPQNPNDVFCPRCLALTHLELDRKSPSHS